MGRRSRRPGREPAPVSTAGAYPLLSERVARRIEEAETRAGEDRAAADRLYEELMQVPASARSHLVEAHDRYASFAFAERLLATSLQARTERPEASQELARLALEVAERLDPERYGWGLVADLKARSWAYLGDAWSRSAPQAAREAFRLARSLLRHGSGDPLEEAEVLGLAADLSPEVPHAPATPGRRKLSATWRCGATCPRGYGGRRCAAPDREAGRRHDRMRAMPGSRDQSFPTSAGSGSEMAELHSPADEPQLLLLRSVLDGAGILYFVKGDAFGSLALGPQIDHYNRKTIYVHPVDFEEARELVEEFLSKTIETRRAAARDLRFRDVVRMVVEVLVFGWFMPGRRHRSARRPDLRVIRGGRSRDVSD